MVCWQSADAFSLFALCWQWSEEFSFTTAPKVGTPEVVIGTVGDMGTHSSSRRLAEVIKLHPELQMVRPLLARALGSLAPIDECKWGHSSGTSETSAMRMGSSPYGMPLAT